MSDAKEKLKAQIRAIRATLDPDILRWAEGRLTGAEPYDRAAARNAVETFLRARTGDARFLKKLRAKLTEAGALEPKKPAGD